ncbi:uncharacterized protein [Triticum aestivum]|uniref:uncharacterized protein n=1 Tax=Triticum aestivum TaxID=4565 RepID=UPI001D01ECF0|nr:uncharacterized protein LOC123094626 [Triticum aestivum]
MPLHLSSLFYPPSSLSSLLLRLQMQTFDIDDKGDEKNSRPRLESMVLEFSKRGARGAVTAMFTQFLSFLELLIPSCRRWQYATHTARSTLQVPGLWSLGLSQHLNMTYARVHRLHKGYPS